jgi:hypothetical protein
VHLFLQLYNMPTKKNKRKLKEPGDLSITLAPAPLKKRSPAIDGAKKTRSAAKLAQTNNEDHSDPSPTNSPPPEPPITIPKARAIPKPRPAPKSQPDKGPEAVKPSNPPIPAKKASTKGTFILFLLSVKGLQR